MTVCNKFEFLDEISVKVTYGFHINIFGQSEENNIWPITKNVAEKQHSTLKVMNFQFRKPKLAICVVAIDFSFPSV